MSSRQEKNSCKGKCEVMRLSLRTINSVFVLSERGENVRSRRLNPNRRKPLPAFSRQTEKEKKKETKNKTVFFDIQEAFYLHENYL